MVKCVALAVLFDVLNRYKQTTSVTNLLSHLGWISLQSPRKIARLTMLYKILNNMAEVDFGRLNKTQEPKVRAPAKRDRRAHSHQLARIQCLRNYQRHSFLPRTIIIIIIIINLIYIAQFDTNGILTALYIVITYIQMQYVHVCTYAEQSYKYTYTCLHIHTYTVTCTNIHLPTY